MSDARRDEAYGLLLQLHEMIDQMAEPLHVVHQARLQCKRGCSGCCVDDLTVFEIEAHRIRTEHASLLEAGAPAPAGGCAFLDDEGACRIYHARPYVCRTQGLPLRWLEQEDDGVAEYRDICPLNVDPKEPLEVLDAQVCWPIGPVEQKLAAFQEAFGGPEMKRVSLRSLFEP